MITHTENQDWISIAEQVSVEEDPTKLMVLVEQLCSALDGVHKAPARSTPPDVKRSA